jgi:hypothetical protein
MIKKFIVPISIVIAAVVIGGVLFYVNQNKNLSSNITALSAQVVADKSIEFINKNLLQPGATAVFTSVNKENELYKIKFKINDQEVESYASVDGKILFLQGFGYVNMDEVKATSAKRDKPDVKLFVMSYCPFGLQAQKALLPVYNLLKNKADIGVYFVSYIMHEKKEIDENLRQYCIQKENKDQYFAYLSCFTTEQNADKCLAQAGVDVNKTNACVSQTDQQFKVTESYNNKSTWLSGKYPLFDVHKDLNQQYGVSGSPTLIINDKVSDAERTPEGFKKAICEAFNVAPEECSQTLSGDTGAANNGSCQ